MGTPTPGPWPLVGRVDEIDRALAALGATRGAVLSGAPGAGTSRLGAEVRRAAAAQGWATVELSAGPETVAAPFSPFAPLLDGGEDDDIVSRFLRVERVLVGLGQRVLVSLDDAHLLDDVSVAFVRHLVTATPVRLLLTLRSGAPVPPTIVTLWQAGHLERVEVLALARDETSLLVDLALPGDVDHRVHAWVWDTTRGNPLFARELVLDAIERGALAEQEGRWVLTGTRGAGSRLQEVVAARVGSLGDEEREAVELVALAEPMSLAVLEELVGADVVRRIDERGLFAGHADRRRPSVRLAHPLHGEVARATMGLTAGRDHRRRLIDAFVATGARRSSDRQQLGLWRCEIGDLTDWQSLLESARELATGGDRALLTALHSDDAPALEPTTRSSLEKAAVLARGALDGGRSVAAAALLFGLLCRLGRDAEAAGVYAEAERLVETEDDAAWLLRMRTTGFFFGHEPPVQARERRAVVGEAADPDLRLAASASDAAAAAVAGQLGDALSLAREVLAADGGAGEDRLLAAGVVAVGLAEVGLVGEGLEQIDAVLSEMTAGHGADLAVAATTIRSNLLAVGGRLDEAEELIWSSYAVADALGDTSSMGQLVSMAAYLALDRGEAGRAVALATEAVDRLAGADPFAMRRASMVFRVHACALLGDDAAIAEALRALDADLTREAPRWDELRARAWCDVASGRMAIALARFQAHAELHAAEGLVVREAMALHDLVRLGHPAVGVERLAELADAADTPVLDVMAEHARAAAASEANALLAVGERWDEFGFHLLAAEAFSQACAAFGTSASREVAAARARSHRSLARCGPVRTPALSSAGARAALTKRESEIAWLAARGRTDREIAEELVVSIRTVQTHLYNAYAKLGIDGRDGLDVALKPS